jgi:hypothetical protein
MKDKLILHAIVMHKPKFKSKEQAFNKANEMFPNEKLKGFVRDSGPSFRVRAVPKTKFIHTSFISKKITPDITLVFGYLK